MSAAQIAAVPFGILLLVLPGLVWWSWSPDTFRNRAVPEILGDMFGISLAVSASLGLLTYLTQWRIPGWLMILGALVASGLALYPRFRSWRGVRELKHADKSRGSLDGNWVRSDWQWEIIPLVIFVLILSWRFYQARTLVFPAWVDSVHHTYIIRLIVETGGVPATLEPNIQAPFYYHFGFHLNTAVFAFWSRLHPETAVLILGQVINAGVCLAIFRLGISLWGDWRRASLAMVLVGFVFQMPAYYLTWGRYTLLTGITLSILAISSAIEMHREGFSRERAFRLILLTAGVILTHYYAALLFGIFVFILLTDSELNRWFTRRKRALALSSKGENSSENLILEHATPDQRHPPYAPHPGFFKSPMLWPVLIGVILTSPWIWNVLTNSINTFGLRTVLPGDSVDEVFFSDYLEYLWFLLGPQRSYVVLGVALCGLVLLGWRRERRTFAVWTLILIGLSLPWGVNLAPFRPDHGVILAFLPGSLWAADAILWPWISSDRGWIHTLAVASAVLAIVGLFVWGVKESGNILNPVTILADEADQQALDWIERNIPPEAAFYINVTHWQNGVYRGVDGGWWLTPLEGRMTLLPPVLFMHGDPGYWKEINRRAKIAENISGCTDDFWDLVSEINATFIYTKEGSGSLQSAALEDCSGIQSLYNRSGVRVFRIVERD